MSAALVCGSGLVARRVARQLVDGGKFASIGIAARSARDATKIVDVLGDIAQVVVWPLTAATVVKFDVVATALADDNDIAIAKVAVECGVPIASAADGCDAVAGLRALDVSARERATTVIAGCGFAPGFSDVLAMHAGSLFTTVDEIRVARAGGAGPSSIAAIREQRRDVPAMFRQGVWKECSRLEEQVWFPEPINAADCQVVRGGGEFLAQYFGRDVAITTCWAEAKSARWPHRNDDGLGAVRVEVWGERDGHRDVVVYGAIDRVSIAAGAMLGRVAEILADSSLAKPFGVHGVAAIAEPADMIRTLAERGLEAAVFEGAPIS